MKAKISNLCYKPLTKYSRRGFTLVELIVSSLIMLIVILTTLSLYTRSNKITVDHQQFAEVQHDVRAVMYFISRDIKSIGAGLPLQFSGYFLEGVNNDQNQNPPVKSDKLSFFGNSDPLRLVIQNFDPGPNTITLEPNEFGLYPYNENTYPDDPKGYINRTIIVLPDPDKRDDKGEIGRITSVDLVANQITFEPINVKLPHAMNLNPGGSAADYVGGTIHFIELKTYWLDSDGSYPSLTAGEKGYLGQPGVLYSSLCNPIIGDFEHLALAPGIEDLQFQYHGDLDGDQQLDDNNADGVIDENDFQNWDEINWTNKPEVVAGIRSVRIWVLGKTENPFVSFSGTPPDGLKYIYGKPLIADSPGGAQADKHRRFLLESTAQVRNMSLGLYNSNI